MGYSPPKCTCHGKQSHSSKYMILLECLHAQSHVSSPHRLPHTCFSQMRVKSQFSKQKLFFLENLLPRFDKYIGLPSEANCWITLRNIMVLIRSDLLDDSPRKFFGKSSFEIPFTNIFPFYFLSCHALTPNILGCPDAYGMHYANPNKLILIYKTCIY